MTAVDTLFNPDDALHRTRHAILAFLLAQGYGAPAFDPAGNLVFHAEGLTFCMLFDDLDTEYVQISLPNFYLIDSEEEAGYASKTARICQRAFKLGVYQVSATPGSWVSATVPLLMHDASFFTTDRLYRLTHLLRTMAEDFVRALQTRQMTDPRKAN